MSYRFTVINAYWAFMKESELEVLKIDESEFLCTDSAALISLRSFPFAVTGNWITTWCKWKVTPRSPQISHKSWSHLQTPGARRVTWIKFHTEHPKILKWLMDLTVIWCLMLGYMWTDTHFGTCVKNCSNCAGNIRRHRTKFRRRGSQNLWTPDHAYINLLLFCTTLFKLSSSLLHAVFICWIHRSGNNGESSQASVAVAAAVTSL
jgi:hypothetical protein